MDDFPDLFANDFDMKHQGKSASMPPPRNPYSGSDFTQYSPGTAKSTSNPIFDDRDRDGGVMFNDIYGGPHKYSSEPSATTAAQTSSFDYDSLFKDSKPPVFDKPVYDDDFFDEFPGVKTSPSTSAAKYDDVFPISGSPLSPKNNKSTNSSGFDDLLGWSSSPAPARSTSETGQSQNPASFSSMSGSTSMDNPFVDLGSTIDHADSSSGLFIDPNESGSGGMFENLDPFDGIGNSVPPMSSEVNKRGKDRSPIRSESAPPPTVSRKQQNDEDFEHHIKKKMPSMEDFPGYHQPMFGMPCMSTNFHSSVGQSTSPPAYPNVSSNDTSSQVNTTPRSENFDTYGDVWLTVSEIPLFTQPTSAPPPSRPPPPRPPRVSKSMSGSSPSTNAKKNINERAMQDALDREVREKQERQRERQQREMEEEEREQRRSELEREREEEVKEQKRLEKERERVRQMEREKERVRQAVERATREARERAASEARARAERAAVEKAATEARQRAERAGVQRAQAEARERAATEARERAERAVAEAREREVREREARERAKLEAEARLKAERAAAERAASEARERAAAYARASQQVNDDDLESFFFMGSRPSSSPRPRANSSDPMFDEKNKGGPEVVSSMRKASSTTDIVDDLNSIFGAAASSSGSFQDVEGETEERRRARLERHQRTQERAAKALAEKNQRDLQVQREQAERHRIAETVDVEIKRWAAGKEGNMRALLSTLQYVLWPACGWQPVSLTDLITAAAVKKAYRKATLCVHPDKVQQKGANLQQKYVAEKVFDLLKEAWNKFNSEELF